MTLNLTPLLGAGTFRVKFMLSKVLAFHDVTFIRLVGFKIHVRVNGRAAAWHIGSGGYAVFGRALEDRVMDLYRDGALTGVLGALLPQMEAEYGPMRGPRYVAELGGRPRGGELVCLGSEVHA